MLVGPTWSVVRASIMRGFPWQDAKTRARPTSRALDDDTLWICLPSLAAMRALDTTHRLDLWISDILDASQKLVALWLQGWREFATGSRSSCGLHLASVLAFIRDSDTRANLHYLMEALAPSSFLV